MGERTRPATAKGFAGVIVLATLVGFVTFGVPTAAASDLCGMTITSDLELDHDLSCPGSGLIVGSDGIAIDLNGHTISGSGTVVGSVGIRVDGRSDVSIAGPGTVKSFQTGVLVANSFDVVVEQVTAMANGFMAAPVPPFPLSPSDGIHVTMSHDVVVQENLAKGNADDGINLHKSTGVSVLENIVDDNRHDGIRLDLADGNVIAENFVVGHDLVLPGTPPARAGCGIEVFGSKNNLFEENVLSANHNGIRLRRDLGTGTASAGNSVRENEIDGSGAAEGGGLRGIHLRDSSTSENVVAENTIAENAAGIAFTDGTPTGNAFVENTIQMNTCGVRGPTVGNTFEENTFANNGSDFCP